MHIHTECGFGDQSKKVPTIRMGERGAIQDRKKHIPRVLLDRMTMESSIQEATARNYNSVRSQQKTYMAVHKKVRRYNGIDSGQYASYKFDYSYAANRCWRFKRLVNQRQVWQQISDLLKNAGSNTRKTHFIQGFFVCNILSLR